MKKFEKRELEEFFESIGGKLAKRTRVFLLGGGAMAYRGQKVATKDLDLVFEKASDCSRFASVISRNGFTEKLVLEQAYKKMAAAGGIWVNKAGLRLDLFAETVCNALKLSRGMVKRSTILKAFGNLEVTLVSNEDILLFKSITEREDDTNDIAAIIRSSKIDWSTVVSECRAQSSKRMWYGSLLNKLSELREKHGISVPIEREIDALYKTALLRTAFERRREKGISKEEAIGELKKEGFTDKELRDAGIAAGEKVS